MVATAKKPSRITNRLSRISQNGDGEHVEVSPVHIKLLKPDIRTMQVHLVGVTPLIVHRFTEKARKQITDKEQQKAKGPREKRDPHQEYLDSFYMMPGTKPETKGARYGIPASGFKRACENVCGKTRFVQDMAATFVQRAFFILDDEDGLVELDSCKPRMRTDIVRIGGFAKKTPQERYRPEFKTWSVTLRVRYNATAISAEQIVNIFMFAGLHEGWGEMRAGKGGSNGQWEVRTK